MRTKVSMWAVNVREEGEAVAGLEGREEREESMIGTKM